MTQHHYVGVIARAAAVSAAVLLGVCELALVPVGAQPARHATALAPFGLGMGQAKGKLGMIVEQIEPNKFLLDSVPKPHPELEMYVATVTPKSGLCSVRALSADVRTTSDGTELRARFEKMVAELAGIHGKPAVLDTLFRGSVHTQPQDWMAALLKKERALFAMWSAERATLNPDLSRVTVSVAAVSPKAGYVAVQYYFSNYEQCRAEISAAGDGVSASTSR